MTSHLGAKHLRWTLHLLIAAALAAPAASAWTIAPAAPDARPSLATAAWTTDLSPAAFPGNAAAAAVSAVGCALGDVSGDGIADLLVLVADPASGLQKVQALAGPGFQEVVWEKVGAVGQVLQCAPDLDLDGTLDPIVQSLGAAAGTAAAGAADQARHQVQQVLDGASGAAMLGRIDAESVTGAATGAASTGLAAGQQATSVLLPAAAGAAAYLQTSATDAVLQLPATAENLLPVGALTATASQAAELQILDVTGSVVATVSIDEAGVDPVALAPVLLTGALPDVAVLSMAAISPVQQATAGIPELALYTADGTLAWTTQLAPSTGVPLLVPNVGDLNLDGVGDLIVTTVEQQVQAVPAAAYSVISGVDGSILFTSGPAVSGLVAALPLGQLPDGLALLEAVQVEGATTLTLSALDGAGSVLWSVDVDGLARPVNAAIDAYTGDILGFTDLTGDAIPDVAVAVDTGTGLAIQAIDGATGAIAWDLDLPDVSEVMPVVVGLAEAAQGAAGAVGAGAGADASVDGSITVANLPGLGDATDLVQETAVGATSALLALGHSSTNATLALIDAVTGEVVWTAVASLPASFDVGSFTAQVAGDLDADQVQDLLVSVVSNASVAAEGAAAAASGTTSGTIAAVSGATGETLYTQASLASAPSGLEFESTFGPASAGQSAPESNGIPGPGPALLALALAVGVALRRRRA